MTISDLESDVHERTRTHIGPEGPVSGGNPARARAIPTDTPCAQGDMPGTDLEISDHSELISEGSGLGRHVAEAGLAMAENFLTMTPPVTVGSAWRGIGGDPGEFRGRGLGRVLLWLCGLIRALLITALYAPALGIRTRRQTGGTILILAALVATYLLCRALLP